MTKNKFKLVPILAIFMLFICAITSISLFSQNIQYSMAESAQRNENFYLTAFDRDGSQLFTEEETIFNGSKAYVYKWEELKTFKFNFDPTKKVPTKNYDQGVETYNFVVEVEHIKDYPENVPTWNPNNNVSIKALTVCSKIEKGPDSYLNIANWQEAKFDIDRGTTGEYIGETVNISTWGIYRFRYSINGYEHAVSDFFIVLPTQEVSEAPRTQYTEQGLNEPFIFTLKNANVFKYVDQENLVWYALGKSNDGGTFCLTYDDINSGRKEFENCSPIEKTYARTGSRFVFDDLGYTGNWKIWCEYNGNEASIMKSNTQKIYTGNNFNKMTILWIVLGAGVLAIIICISIAAYKVKRERIY